MNLFHRLGNAVEGFRKGRNFRGQEKYISRGRITSTGAATHPLAVKFKIAQDDLSTDPRDHLEIQRLMWRIFPFISAGVEKHIFMKGTPVLTSPDDGWQKVLDEFQHGIKIQREVKSEFPSEGGLKMISDKMLLITARDGNYFHMAGIDHEDENAGLEFDHVTIYDPANFDYQCVDLLNDKLYYSSPNGYLVEVPKTEGFCNFHTDSVEWSNWGAQLLYNSDFIGNILLGDMLSERNRNRRLGNPPGFNLLTVPYDEAIKSGSLDSSNGFDSYITPFRDAFNKGMKGVKKSDESFDIFAPIPYEAKLHNFTYGQGVTGNTNFAETYHIHFNQIAVKLKWPAELIGGRGGSSGGIGSGQFEIAKEQVKDYADHNRKAQEPCIWSLFELWLMGRGEKINNIERYETEIIWDAPDLDDQKLAAEIVKVEADAYKTQLENYAFILEWIEGNATNAAEEYAHSIDREEWISENNR